MYQQHSTATFDVVHTWRDVVTQKYANLTGICSFHDFLLQKNPGVNAETKVRDECYTGDLQKLLMKLELGYLPADVA